MLNAAITPLKRAWLDSSECSVKALLHYIRQCGKLRAVQIDALETYLFLKIKGENKPLWQLFSEGFFIPAADQAATAELPLPDSVKNNRQALALYLFAKEALPPLAEQLRHHPERIDYAAAIKKIFYKVPPSPNTDH